MFEFISENLGSIIVGAVVFAVVLLAVIKIIRDRKSSSCSCGGCSGCAGYNMCSIRRENDKNTPNLNQKHKK
ncbi:MAG: FeoB-associated Cys-rich membrane protein [Clostridiales bacterium]|nr:FeoB-associated Cys-rich membrane protein [Clostridiales bacterium]